MCGTITRCLKGKTKEHTQLKFYKVMAVVVLLYGTESWFFEKEGSKSLTSSRHVFPKVSKRVYKARSIEE